MNKVESDIQVPWPYQLRRSLKARYIKIHLELGKPIEVVYPRWVNRFEALRFLQQQITWVSKQTRYIESLVDIDAVFFPEALNFPCLNKQWKIKRETDVLRTKPLCREHGGELILIGSESVEDCQWIGLLKAWMKRVAIECLEPMLVKLSDAHGFDFSRVQWRFQKTRWGSCSHRASISLNIKLLFLPLSLVEYVMLHELCHTKYLNHGSGFWRLLEQVCPDARAKDKQLALFDFAGLKWLS